jgi:hypothetical protein
MKHTTLEGLDQSEINLRGCITACGHDYLMVLSVELKLRQIVMIAGRSKDWFASHRAHLLVIVFWVFRKVSTYHARSSCAGRDLGLTY